VSTNDIGIDTGVAQMLPFSEQAERAVLGSVLIDPGCMVGIRLDENDFYLFRMRKVWL
jgi:replicative DNA helicase